MFVLRFSIPNKSYFSDLLKSHIDVLKDFILQLSWSNCEKPRPIVSMSVFWTDTNRHLCQFVMSYIMKVSLTTKILFIFNKRHLFSFGLSNVIVFILNTAC